MKNIILAVAMLVAGSAMSEEKFLGTIVSAGADTTNSTTAAPFIVPLKTPISIQCTAAAYVITDDSAAVTSARGVTLAAAQFFTGKTSDMVTVVITSTVSAVVRVAGPAATSCTVWARNGDE